MVKRHTHKEYTFRPSRQIKASVQAAAERAHSDKDEHSGKATHSTCKVSCSRGEYDQNCQDNQGHSASSQAHGTACPADVTETDQSASPQTEAARFKHFYSSRDGLISVYEDAAGHLTAIDPTRLA